MFGTWTRGEKQLSLVLVVVLLYHFNIFSFVHRCVFAIQSITDSLADAGASHDHPQDLSMQRST